MQLEKDFNEYRELTLELFNRIQVNGDRLYLLKKREDLLNKIKEHNYNPDEMREIVERLKINELEIELKKKIKEEMEKTKRQILEMKKGERATQAYIMSRYGSYIPSRFDTRY